MIREEDISSTVLVHSINIIFFKSLGKCPHSVCTKYIILKNISSLENIYIYINVRQFCYKLGWVSESMLHFGWMLKIMRRDSVLRSLINSTVGHFPLWPHMSVEYRTWQ